MTTYQITAFIDGVESVSESINITLRDIQTETNPRSPSTINRVKHMIPFLIENPRIDGVQIRDENGQSLTPIMTFETIVYCLTIDGRWGQEQYVCINEKTVNDKLAEYVAYKSGIKSPTEEDVDRYFEDNVLEGYHLVSVPLER